MTISFKPGWNKVIKKSNVFSDKALAAYAKNDAKRGAYWEKKSDAVYAKNYYKYVKVK